MFVITTLVGMWGRNISAMFKAIGHVILLLVLFQIFSDAFGAFEDALTALFAGIEQSVQMR